jgi:DNA-binding NarL/FixJ family response regulator
MRVVIVGPSSARAALRAKLGARGVDVAGEAATIAEARRLPGAIDALVIAPRASDVETARPASAPVESLTPRELDVLNLLALGLSNKGIADRLGISDQTVKFHIASIAGKLGAANRTDAVRRAVRRGLIDL